jgi:hypothetical protein
MATVRHQSVITRGRSSWLEPPEMWAALSIAVMWLAVLFDGIFGPDMKFVSGTPNGSMTIIPSAVVLAIFAFLATVRIAQAAFGRER